MPAEPRVLAFGPDMQPVVSVDPGAIVEFETLDACGGTITAEEQEITLEGLGDDHSLVTGGNPAAGPVEIRGAERGDTLAVRVLAIELSGRGFACMFSGLGPLARRIPENRTWLLEIDGNVGRRGHITVPLRPMIGVVGVATGGDTVANDFPGPHGGNLDNRYLGPGAVVYLPVRQPGAMLALGDVHAAMGDGEMAGSGLEVAARVRVEVGLLRRRGSGWPIVETADAWYTHGAGDDWASAVDIACEEAASLLEREWELEPEEVPLYLTLAGDLGVCQAAQPSPFPVVARVGVQKSATCPRPFREAPAWT